ncbi:MAG: hypothetical protein ABJP70_04560 [Erythrobacter sp.]
MKKSWTLVSLALPLSLALAACNGGAGEGDAEGGEAEDEAAGLANGVPAYEGFSQDDLTGEETDKPNKRHQVTYDTKADPGDVFAFYRKHYTDADYKIEHLEVSFEADNRDFGGRMSVRKFGGDSLVWVIPNKGSGEYSATTQLGDGFPVYPDVDPAVYEIDERSNGSRLAKFKINADMDEIFDFYRDAGLKEGFDIDAMRFDAESKDERLSIYMRENDVGTEVRVTQWDEK